MLKPIPLTGHGLLLNDAAVSGLPTNWPWGTPDSKKYADRLDHARIRQARHDDGEHGLAQVLICDPKILLMDEPFGRVPRATGKDKQVTDIGRRKYFRPSSWHVSNIFVDEQQYTTATALEQRRERFPDANNDG